MTAVKPLKPTVLVPCVLPKFNPLMVTDAPTEPDVGERLVIVGNAVPSVTVKVTQLLDAPPTVTSTQPVVAPDGAATVMDVALQVVGVAAVPLNVTVLTPCVAPKLDPVIVTDVPTWPELGERLPISGVTDASWYSSALER